MLKKLLNKAAVYATCLFVGTAIAVLGLAVMFRILDADMTNSFVNWTYNTANTLVQPFRAVFGDKKFGTGHVLDVAYLFAIVAYTVFGAMVIALVSKLTNDEEESDKASNKK